jgi:hypothetical protein
MPSDPPEEQIAAIVGKFAAEVDPLMSSWVAARSAAEFRTAELEIAARGRALSDAITAVVLTRILANPEFQAATTVAARATPGVLRHGGRRDVTVTLLGGTKVSVKTEYLERDHRGRRGRPRGSGKRGEGGTGLYPALSALGVSFGVTPALAGEICRQVSDSDSVRAGRAALDRRGIDLGHKQTLRIVNLFSRRAVAQRQEWLAETREAPPPTDGALRGKRVVVAVDGGRLRERKPARRGRRREATRHRSYEAPWREPKLLVIYVIDDEGRVESSFHPVYDGTLGDCDALYGMLVGYLRALGAHAARELIIVGDGAHWIWNRTAELAGRLEISADRITEVIDWYHAVETLHEIAAAPARWTQTQRDKWVRRAKRLLYQGRIDDLLALIDALAIGRRATEVKKHRNYFDGNRGRMRYAQFEAIHVPIGSGAVESAIRRVINMRLKSNGMFWLEINAEGMLMLRSYLKAGRFDELVDWSIAAAAPWWNSQHSPSPVESSSPSHLPYAEAA